MRSFLPLLTSLSLAGAACFVSTGAQAYCRSKACDTEPSYGDAWDGTDEPAECVRNAQGCFLEGTPLFWGTGCLTFGVQRDGSVSSGIDFETARETIQAGFDTWAAADCGDGETPSFRVVDKGEIACDRIEYNQRAPNANVFLFRDDDWPYRNLGAHALALTTITYGVETAEIYDVDVELNSHQTTFTTSDEPAEIVSDLSSVVTHEIGHFLGLSHSAVSSAVMRGIGYVNGTTELRELTEDDIAGVCEIFPPGPANGSCAVRHGFSTECGSEPAKEDGGCSVGPQGDRRSASSAAAFVVVALGFALRRRRALER
jgi:MYXO-CTERM domain-containing protein